MTYSFTASNREKFNIGIAIMENIDTISYCTLGASIFFCSTIICTYNVHIIDDKYIKRNSMETALVKKMFQRFGQHHHLKH